MRVVRSLAAIILGLGFMAATTTVGTLVASVAFGETRKGITPPTPPTGYFYVSLIVLGMGSVVGGWLAARMASFAPYGHAAGMAAIVAVLSIEVATGTPSPGQPGWYPSATGLVAVVGILLGGKLRAAANAPAENRVRS
jgi:hypothetical protein